MQLEKQIYGYVFVFDCNDDGSSFKLVEDVISYISDYCEKKRQYSGLITKKILVANKIDLVEEKKRDKVFNSCQRLLTKFPMP
jgi:GTPase SAR1 family protein